MVLCLMVAKCQFVFQLCKQFKNQEYNAKKEHDDGYFVDSMHHFQVK
jgi:hypothetical protein